jgi:N-acetylglucosaminyl-diphospho-decaprenol L-rhamnosyltransferase
MKLSVITVTYNNEETIDDYLNSVIRKLPEKSELIVVDSGSTDKTVERLRDKKQDAKDKDIRIIESEENIGYGAGNNLGAKKAQGEYLFFLNPDTKVLDDSLKKLIEFADLVVGWGIIAPRLSEDSQKVQPSVRNLPTLSGVFKEYFLGQKNKYEPYYPKGGDPVFVESVLGAAMLIKKGLFEKIGGFDEKYFMYFEDLDLCRKVQRAGLTIIYYPKAEILHKVGGSINEKKMEWIKESEKKYHGSFNFALLSLLYFLLRGKNYLKHHS